MSAQQHIAILGSGNMGLALAKGLVKAGIYTPQQITLTRRSLPPLAEHAANGYNTTTDNAKAVADATIVVLAVLPQQLNKLLAEIKPSINPAKQLLISVISGVNCVDIRQQLGLDVQVVRAMPNTAIAIGESMTCIATDNVGSNDANLNLSKNRAESVKTYLVGKGANASRIEATGYGETQPIATNKTADGRQKNRRVEFTLY